MKNAFLLTVLFIICPIVSGSDLPPELPDGDVYAPIVHQKYFQHEREVHGYNPRFIPGRIAFDSRNRPYIRVGKTVQTLDENGKWLKLDFTVAIKAKYPDWNGSIKTGPFREERIVFDDDDHAYTHVDGVGKPILLYSKDHCRTWEVYELPVSHHCAKLEYREVHNDTSKPPVLITSNMGTTSLKLVVPEKNPDGTLSFQSPVLLSEDGIGVPYHSGDTNMSITSGDLTHVTWGDLGHTKTHDCIGVPAFAATYNRKSGKLSKPVMLGFGGIVKGDNHNWPVITVDSQGYLHCTIGGHHTRPIYVKSKRPNSTKRWTKPKEILYKRHKMGEGSYTYSTLVCDKNDTLHFFARWGGLGYKDYLVYHRKEVDKDWSDVQLLVEPFKTLYSIWYQKLQVDRFGRMFLNYRYYPDELKPDEARAYVEKYGKGVKLPEDLDKRVNGTSLQISPKEPAVLVSEDFGKSWHLAITKDFTEWIVPAQRPGVPAVEKFTNSIGMDFILVKPGSFTMGDNDGYYDERGAHDVHITKPFYLGKYEVTVAQFRKFTEETGFKTQSENPDATYFHDWLNGSFFDDDWRTEEQMGSDAYKKRLASINWKNPNFDQADDHPVVCINYNDAKEFCEWLSKKEGRKYRLPTEAEWEYACRAGTTTNYSFGNRVKKVKHYGWYKENSPDGTQPVGGKKPNPWGFYDMHGNVWEFCEDWFGLYSDSIAIDPTGRPDDSGSGKVIRGGSWTDDVFGHDRAYNLRSSARYYYYYPQIKINFVGMRLVLECN